ncbi:MAG: DUF748 domain-containing protein [Phycisphaerae bacterium]
MSETPTTPAQEPEPDKPETDAAAHPPASGKQRKPKEPRRWRRRLMRLGIVVFVLLIALRFAVFFALPTVLRNVAALYELELAYERQELTVLAGDAGLWYVTLTPTGETQPLIRAEYVRGNLDVLALFAGRLDVLRAEADGVEIQLDRDETGRFPAVEKVLAAITDGQEPDPDADIDFTSPLQVEALRVNGMKVRLNDKSVTPEQATALNLNLRMNDIGMQQRPIRLAAEVWSDKLLDLLRAEGTVRSEGKKLDARLNVFVSGLQPSGAQSYLRPLGLVPVARNLAANGTLSIQTDAPADGGSGISAQVELTDFSLRADAEESLAVPSMKLVFNRLDFTEIDVAEVLVAGPRLAASRSAEGRLTFAGIELGSAQDAPPPAAPVPAAVGSAGTSPATPTAPVAVRIGAVTIEDAEARFADVAVSPAGELTFAVERLVVGPIDLASPQQPVPVEALVAAPGLWREFSLAGSLTPLAGKQAFDAGFTVTGIRPDAAGPYLAPLGVTSSLTDGRLTGKVQAAFEQLPDGTLALAAGLEDLRLTDGTAETSLFELAQLSLDGIELAADASRVRLGEVTIRGPGIDVRRDVNGLLHAAGFRLDVAKLPAPAPRGEQPMASLSAQPVASPSADGGVVSTAVPRIEIGRLTWGEIRLRLQDEAFDPPLTIETTEAGVELADILLDLDAEADAPVGSVRAWLSSPGLASRVEVAGTVTPSANNPKLDLTLSGRNVVPTLFAPYLAPLGIEPMLRDGSFGLSLTASLLRDETGVSANLSLRDGLLADGGEQLAALQALSVSDVRFADGGVSVGAITVAGGRLAVARASDGYVEALGLRIAPPVESATVGADAAKAPVAAAAVPAEVTTILPVVGPPVRVASVRIEDTKLALRDAWIPGGLTTNVDVVAAVTGLVLNEPADPARFLVDLSLEGIVQQARLSGTLGLSPAAPSVTLQAEAGGIDGAPLEAYLPAGVTADFADGTARATLDASAALNHAGGVSASLDLRDVLLSPGNDAPAFVLGSFVIDAPRIDPAGGALDFASVTSAGLSVEVKLEPDGALRVPGLRVGTPTQLQLEAAEKRLPKQKAQIVEGEQAGDAAALVAAARQALPLMTLGQLDLKLDRLSVARIGVEGAVPVVLEDFTLKSGSPLAFGGGNPATLPPMKLSLAGGISPLARSVEASLEAAPLADEAFINGSLAVTGIDMAAVQQVLPEVAAYLGEPTMRDGSFRGTLNSRPAFQKRGLYAIDFAAGVEGELSLSDLYLRAQENGPVLLGLESLVADGFRVAPRTGTFTVRTLEVNKPVGRLWRDEAGVHALGLVLKLPEPAVDAPWEAEPTETVVVASAEPVTPVEPASSEPAAPPAGEFRIDRLLVTGLDLTIEDGTVSPPLLLPLTSLDVEARGISSRLLSEESTLRFTAVVGSGDVPLPRFERGRGVPGAIGAILGGGGGGGVSEADAMTETEQRELFSQITAGGRLRLYPRPDGFVKLNVSGLELAGFAGNAAEAGAAITAGILDFDLDARFIEEGIDLKTRTVLTDLMYEEPPGGPVARHIPLPAPLDAVIDIVQDASGAITLPVTVEVRGNAIDTGQIIGSATGAVGGVLARAVASAPVKAVQGVGNVVGLGGLFPNRAIPDPAAVVFPVGGSAPSAADRAALAPLADYLRSQQDAQATLRHTLTLPDVELAARRANPPLPDLERMAGELRQRRIDLQGSRAELVSRVSSELLTGFYPAGGQPPSLARLRQVEADLALTEAGMDELYKLLRPGADRQADRRTRQAALEIARRRLEAVRAVLQDLGVQDAGERVRLTNPTYDVQPEPAGGSVVVELVGQKRL